MTYSTLELHILQLCRDAPRARADLAAALRQRVGRLPARVFDDVMHRLHASRDIHMVLDGAECGVYAPTTTGMLRCDIASALQAWQDSRPRERPAGPVTGPSHLRS